MTTSPPADGRRRCRARPRAPDRGWMFHPRWCKVTLCNSLSTYVFAPSVSHAFDREGNDMHGVLKLAVVIFVGVVTSAGATYQPVESAEQTDPISYTSAWPHSTMLSIAPKAAAAASNFRLRMAQLDSDCSACDTEGVQAVGRCQANMDSYDGYLVCAGMVQLAVRECKQRCASGVPPGPEAGVPFCHQFPNNPLCSRVPGAGGDFSLCKQFPNNPACRDEYRPGGGVTLCQQFPNNPACNVAPGAGVPLCQQFPNNPAC
jgi:hypothetical protein